MGFFLPPFSGCSSFTMVFSKYTWRDRGPMTSAPVAFLGPWTPSRPTPPSWRPFDSWPRRPSSPHEPCAPHIAGAEGRPVRRRYRLAARRARTASGSAVHRPMTAAYRGPPRVLRARMRFDYGRRRRRGIWGIQPDSGAAASPVGGCGVAACFRVLEANPINH